MTFKGLSDNPAAQDGFLTLELPRQPTCAALARAFLREHLGEDVDEPALERVLLATSELVANAWKHGQGGIELRLRRDADRVRIEVVDEGNGAGKVRLRTPDATGGWGLHIVNDLSLSWGCYDGTTHVWSEVGLTD